MGLKEYSFVSESMALKSLMSVGSQEQKAAEFPIKENHQQVLATGRELNDATHYRCLVGALSI